ncbi:MAG: nuclear transport factor 2 family protein [marine benthic group bacterium]|jgi:hypothetical protein|nr:nuclear transport factor 2 family protein [Candidatus Benthicola marisminoris]
MSNGLWQEDPLRRLLEKDAVISTVNRLFRSVDEKDWEGAEACLAPSVLLDVTSMAGGEPEHTTGKAIVEGWRETLTPIAKVHHQAGNYEVQVRGEEANASCYGIAVHYLPNDTGRDTRIFVGTYAMRLRKSGGAWRIYRFRYDLKFMDGNPDLEGEA